jgi:hypothetical protein
MPARDRADEIGGARFSRVEMQRRWCRLAQAYRSGATETGCLRSEGHGRAKCQRRRSRPVEHQMLTTRCQEIDDDGAGKYGHQEQGYADRHREKRTHEADGCKQ